MHQLNFQVLKTSLHQTRLTNTKPAALQAGEVRLAVQRFAFTANNITYAAFGDAMKYWQFFPTPDAAWGSIPVWGFADAVESACEGVAVGERFYGYYPMASHVTLLPARVNDHGFYDAAPHRAELHPVYNQYVASRTDPLYSADTEDIQALLRPLFVTSFLIDDFLADNDFFGANTLLLSSASSKTAYGTAFQLAQRKGIEIIGLTSAANAQFCEGLGCYHRVLTYDQLDQIASDAACAYVDFAGNAKLRHAIHSRFCEPEVQLFNRRHALGRTGWRQRPARRASYAVFCTRANQKTQCRLGGCRTERPVKRGLAGFHPTSDAAKCTLADAPAAQRSCQY